MNEFEQLVSEMRTCQKQYFRTREKEWLERSKRFEKMVDNELDKKLNPNLFS